jgi:cellulose synthase/poly-beta-1,6-N-acetylglucosamine synthase-like glycosyltransferase
MMVIYGLIVLIYCLLVVIVLAGLLARGAHRGKPAGLLDHHPFISVIIPARNEEKHISTVLKSLARQDYPRECFEVIVMNDRSADMTAQMAEGWGPLFKNFGLLKVEHCPDSLYGKQHAIDIGVRAAQGEFIVQTDADCRLAPDFLKAYANVFVEGTDFAFSWTEIRPARGLFALLQAADLMFLMAVAAAFARLGLPLSCMGNNIGFLKKRYEELGGYPGLGASLVEDYQLLTAFRKQRWQVRFIAVRDAMVASLPKEHWADFFFQRMRWARGAAVINLPVNLVTLPVLAANTWTAGIILFLTSVGLSAVLIAFFKLLCDFALFSGVCQYFKRRKLLFLFPLWEVYYLISPVVYCLSVVLSRKKRW